MSHSATYWIRLLGLIPHSEGGYYREIHRSKEIIPRNALPGRYTGDRSFLTSIYYLVEGGRPSRLHRIHSEEIWHFHAGNELTLHMISGEGNHSTIRLGDDPALGQHFHAVIPADTWFGAIVSLRTSYALVSCTMSPGFDYNDWTLARRDRLIEQYPDHHNLIIALTPNL